MVLSDPVAMAWFAQYPGLIEKNTFLDFAPEALAARRASSAPATFREFPANGRRRRRKRAAASAPSDGAAALREYAARARAERWALWVKRVVARRCDVAWRWNRMVRGMPRKPVPRIRACVSARMLLHLVQYAMRPADLIIFFAVHVLRKNGNQIEVWASDVQLRAGKIKRLLVVAEYFLLLAARGEIMLHIPSHDCTIQMQWDKNLAVSELQWKAAGKCGVPTERQMVQFLGREVQGRVLGDVGVLPGDAIEIMLRD